jgi:hypothetical protein
MHLEADLRMLVNAATRLTIGMGVRPRGLIGERSLAGRAQMGSPIALPQPSDACGPRTDGEKPGISSL